MQVEGANGPPLGLDDEVGPSCAAITPRDQRPDLEQERARGEPPQDGVWVTAGTHLAPEDDQQPASGVVERQVAAERPERLLPARLQSRPQRLFLELALHPVLVVWGALQLALDADEA